MMEVFQTKSKAYWQKFKISTILLSSPLLLYQIVVGYAQDKPPVLNLAQF